ncbi:hypothetical protein Acsp03_46880 [Actinomadura sp. NBRC 104412]|uniref:MinD/ParA family ATP-binding protein n=1 Tax=Actinomadura sp. NBRC 104412 TaxID=3032203 RepID=UPI0024A4F514|nr:AAA family ATPase [Actinomadura sp. NBRC 104412]GLZ07222.1 hypothetical protein Acsp03_46880 [Actinomadura sp. NBRC 104412]
MARNDHDGRSLEERLASLDAMNSEATKPSAAPPAPAAEPAPSSDDRPGPDEDATIVGRPDAEKEPAQAEPESRPEPADNPWLAPPPFQNPPSGEGFGPPPQSFGPPPGSFAAPPPPPPPPVPPTPQAEQTPPPVDDPAAQGPLPPPPGFPPAYNNVNTPPPYTPLPSFDADPPAPQAPHDTGPIPLQQPSEGGMLPPPYATGYPQQEAGPAPNQGEAQQPANGQPAPPLEQLPPYPPGQFGPPEGGAPQYPYAGGAPQYNPQPHPGYGPPPPGYAGPAAYQQGPYQGMPAQGAPPQGYPQQQPPPPESSESLSSENLLGERRIAPSSGWRRAVYKATGGSVHPGESQAELRRKDLIARVRQPVVNGHHRVAVMSLKGGVGKTTTTTGLGSMLASLRGDRVIAVDANPDRGTLSDKVKLETAATVRDLLNNRDKIHRYADLRAFTSQNSARLEVLASDRDPAVSEAFSAEDYSAVAVILEQYYSICITDCGTGLLHSAMAGVLALADQLVLVSSPSVDGARSASATLDWLEAHNHGHLVRNGVVVLSMVRHRTRSQVDLDKLQAHFESRCRAVVRIPYDDHLEEGAEIELEALATSTREAYLNLAAVIGDGLGYSRPT